MKHGEVSPLVLWKPKHPSKKKRALEPAGWQVSKALYLPLETMLFQYYFLGVATNPVAVVPFGIVKPAS
jgi:hypothetical protein